MKEGTEYFEKACEYGYIKGCTNAGLLRLEEHSVRDYEKGLSYMSMACEKDQGPACSAIGTGYLLGRYGLEKNIDKSMMLLQKGCELGSVNGCVNLSRIYKIGDGVQRNDALAHKYQKLAMKANGAMPEGNAPGITLGRTN